MENLNILETTKFLMKKYNITASKALGQNFLINEEVIKTAVDTSNIRKRRLSYRNRSRTWDTYKRTFKICWKSHLHRAR